MRPLGWLQAPWRSAHRSLGWLTVVVGLLAVAAALAVATLSARTDALVTAFGVLGAGELFLWAFFMPCLLLLAIDARALRLPGVQREIHASLLVYALLSVGLPVLLAGALGVDMPTVASVLGLCAAIGLGFALLPRYLAVLLGFMPALRSALRQQMPIPGPGEPGFVTWALLAVLLLLCACIVRWRSLVRTVEPVGGFRGAMVFQLRRNGAMGQWGADQADSLQQIRRRPDWLQAGADLRGIGPATPLAALRVALGHWYLPRTLGGHLHAAAPALLSLLLGLATMLLIGLDGRHPRAVSVAMRAIGVGLVGWVGVFGSLMVTLMTVQRVTARWRKPNTELPLLSLLPGLGAPAQAKRNVLLAILRRPLAAQCLLLVMMIAVGLGLHLSPLGLLSVGVAQLGGVAVLLACVPAALGGGGLQGWTLAALVTVLCILTSLGSLLPLAAIGEHPWPLAQPLLELVLSLWLVTGVVLLRLGQRGWRALTARPHAFLINPA